MWYMGCHVKYVAMLLCMSCWFSPPNRCTGRAKLTPQSNHPRGGTFSPLQQICTQSQLTSPEEQLITLPPDVRPVAKPGTARTANPNRQNRQVPPRRTAKTAKPQTRCFASVSRNRQNRQNRQTRQTQLFYDVLENQLPPKPPNHQHSMASSAERNPWVLDVSGRGAAPAKAAHSATKSAPWRTSLPHPSQSGAP